MDLRRSELRPTQLSETQLRHDTVVPHEFKREPVPGLAGNVQECLRLMTTRGLVAPVHYDELLADAAGAEWGAEISTLLCELHARGMLTHYQYRAVSGESTDPLTIHDYVVLDQIGQGGMAVVYKARRRNSQRIVALKVLSPADSQDPFSAYRFDREVRASAKLDHVNIVTALDAGEDNGRNYLVMEFVDGSDLARYVSSCGPLSVASALDCITQTARGLEHAHHQLMVHRDIKPENLLLDTHGQIKILDLGLVRFDVRPFAAGLSVREQPSEADLLLGTPEFMAPEQFTAPDAADCKVDIYSLGCVLYFLLTGQPPYPGQNAIKVMTAHETAPIPRLTAIRKDVPPVLDGILARMLAKSPKHRFESMEELLAALAQLPAQSADRRPRLIERWSAAVARIRKPSPRSPVPASGPYHRPAAPAPSLMPSVFWGLLCGSICGWSAWWLSWSPAMALASYVSQFQPTLFANGMEFLVITGGVIGAALGFIVGELRTK